MYDREDIASRVVDAPVEETWRNPPDVYEDQDPEKETGFEADWGALLSRLRVFYYLARADRLSGIGSYGVLLIGVNDGSGDNLERPVERVQGPGGVLYLQPLKQNRASVVKYDEDAASERFGKPELYELDLSRKDTKVKGIAGIISTVFKRKKRVHWTRIIHIAEGLTENEVHGEPRLLKVYNRCLDLQKVVAGGAEIWWLNARGILHADLKGGFQEGALSNEDPQIAEWKKQLDNLQHHQTHSARTAGVNLKFLHTPVPNPKPMFDVLVSLIAVAKSIPKRVLTGSERGQLASSQDQKNWGRKINARRDEYAEPVVLRAFVDRLIGWGALTAPGEGYHVEWQDLLAPTPLDRAEVLRAQMQALKAYVDAVDANPAAMLVVDPSEIRESLGLEPRREEDLASLKALLGELGGELAGLGGEPGGGDGG